MPAEQQEPAAKPAATLTVALNYYGGRPELDGEDRRSPQWLTDHYINNAAQQKYPDGMRPRDRRMFARLQEKLQDAVDDKTESIPLENAEIDFLREIFKDAKFPSAMSRYVVVLENEIDRLKK